MIDNSAISPSKRRSSILSTSNNSSDTIKVVCRFRPAKKTEIEIYGQGTNDSFKIDEVRSTVEVIADYEKKSFTFDKV
jgi:hypothetical protein